ncbi:cation acetate symporter [Methylobacterium sp. WL64]|uniref:solute symporter family protein n=1 Tax=Methylobacterium sp. WL64 TaxID=2603894 RepID=UPI0011CA87DF|nr:cation acetate symporter [Methylobacterium sp. WL64]TXN00738.1 cation acetate symporter [Methylobacterium sp. WL64]
MSPTTTGNYFTYIFFLSFITLTLALTWWAARRQSKGASGFFVAGRRLSGLQNGLAISGDYCSAASFLGIPGIVALFGFDGLVYSFGLFVGWITIVLLVAEPVRNSGKYTLSDIMAFRLRARPVRVAAAASSITISMFYLLAQMVGAGVIASLLLPISPNVAIILVGALMVTYVLFGGMVATTYIQIVKAVLIVGTTVLLSVLLLQRFDFSLDHLLQAAAADSGKGDRFLEPGLYFTNKLDLISLGLALLLGTAGLPHIMMRFYTVPDAVEARRSANWVIGIVGLYCLMTTILGFGAAALVGHESIFAANKAGNSAAPLLALQLGGGPGTLGGDALIAFVAAVSFATILAVVAGLIISSASNIAYDLYSQVLRRGRGDDRSEIKVAKGATVAVGLVAIVLALEAQSLNVAFLAGLAFAVAASANLPVVLYSLYWKRFNTAGAVSALLVGLVSAVALALVGPAFMGPKGIVWKDAAPLISLMNPGIISIPLGFLAGALGSLLTSREARSEATYDDLKVRSLTGFGAEASEAGH